MSTSRDEQIARSFIIGATRAVIFRINLKIQTYNSFKPFIDISSFSSFLQEQEILFFVGTIFFIDSIEKESDSIWISDLLL